VHIRDQKALKALQKQQGISPAIAAQLDKALADGARSSASKAGVKASKQRSGRRKPAIVTGESKGEACVRLALQDAFGLWEDGGEVVPELIPFPDRQFRVDFCLPRWRYYVEIDGWQFHGFTKEAHHDDRLRGLYFSARGWLPFRVSHGQAVNSPGTLVDALEEAMALSDPLPRSAIDIEAVPHKHGVWHRLIFNENKPPN